MSCSSGFVDVDGGGSSLSSKGLTVILSWFSKCLSVSVFLVFLMVGMAWGQM